MGCGDQDGMGGEKPSKLHFWGGALTGGASVPFSWMTGGMDAAKSGIWGALVGGLLGFNGLFDEEEDDEDDF